MTSCVAVGTYTDSSGNSQGLLLTGSGTSWTATEAPLPANASPYAILHSVACASVSSCVATGYYPDSLGGQGLLLTGSGTSWTATEAPMPVGAPANPGATLFSVACAPGSSCVVVGTYTDALGHSQAVLLTGSGTSWTAAESPLPTGTPPNPLASLSSVACPSAASCVAAGSYSSSSGSQGLLVTGSGTSWTATESPLPANAAANPAAAPSSVACASGSCLVAGTYQPPESPGNDQGLLVTGSGTSWTASEAPMPADASASPNGGLSSVACPAAASCVATGFYADSSGNLQGLLVTGRAPPGQRPRPRCPPTPSPAKTPACPPWPAPRGPRVPQSATTPIPRASRACCSRDRAPPGQRPRPRCPPPTPAAA